MTNYPATTYPTPRATVLLFVVFMAICLGLGYATLNRYDPRRVSTTDSRVYYRMVVGEKVAAPMAYRPLVPMLARGVLGGVSQAPLGSWEPVFLSLLIVNAAFAAATAVVLVHLAMAIGQDYAVALVAAFLYLSSFVVVNYHLVGMIDSAEAFFLTAVLLGLVRDRWWPVAILIAVGAAAKETIVPFGLCGAAVWWAAERIRGRKVSRHAAASLIGATAASVAVLAACRLSVDLPTYGKYTLTWENIAEVPAALVDCLYSRANIHAFALLLPLGIPRLKKIPPAMLAACAAMGVLALLLGAYGGVGENQYRPWFHTFGPVLILSSSIFLCDLVRGQARDASENEDSKSITP